MKRYTVGTLRVICKPEHFETLKSIVCMCCPDFIQIDESKWFQANDFGGCIPLTAGEVVVLDSTVLLPVGEVFTYLAQEEILLVVDRARIFNAAIFAEMSGRKPECVYMDESEGQTRFKRCRFDIV
jgi:hypothetical protein